MYVCLGFMFRKKKRDEVAFIIKIVKKREKKLEPDEKCNLTNCIKYSTIV